MKVNVKAFAITASLVCGIGLFLLTWWVIIFEGASGAKTVLGLVYRGYSISPIGSLIGLAWGLVDGLIGGAIFAWLYNLIASRFSKQE
jgi:type III secretory pathway component EscT